MKKWAVLIFLISALGCHRRAASPIDKPVIKEFANHARYQPLDLDLKPLKYPRQSERSVKRTYSTFHWFDTANQMFEAADSVSAPGRQRLLKMAHRISSAFYEYGNTYTTMNGNSVPVGNPMAELVYSLSLPQLVNLYNNTISSVEKKIDFAANEIVKPTYTSLNQIDFVVKGLEEFNVNLSRLKDRKTEGFIDQIVSGIDSQFLSGLRNLKRAATPTPETKASEYLSHIKSSIEKLDAIPENQRQGIMVNLDDGIRLARRAENISSPDAVLNLMVDLWLNREQRKKFPASLRFLKRLNDRQLVALAIGEQEGEILSPTEWEKIREIKDTRKMTSLQLLAKSALNVYPILTQEEHEEVEKLKSTHLRAALLDPDAVNFMSFPGTDTEKVREIVSRWLGLAMRLSLPDDLQDGFRRFDDPQLNSLRSYSFPRIAISDPILAGARWTIFDRMDSFRLPGTLVDDGIENVKIFINAKIITSALENLYDVIDPFARQLGVRIRENLFPILKTKRAEAEKWSDESFKSFARYYVSKWFFGIPNIDKEGADQERLIEKYSLPLLEHSKLKLLIRPDGTATSQTLPDETSAAVLGATMTNALYRAEVMHDLFHVSPATQESMSLIYQSINKMALTIGYRGYDGNFADTLTVCMTPNNLGQRLDIRNYDPENLVFAVPDQIILKDNFRLDPQSETAPTASVEGQMEMLSAFALYMKYFKPWVTTSFDKGMALLQIDEDETLEVFSKNNVLAMPFGASSIILRNLPVSMVGVISEDERFFESKEVDLKNVDLVGAVIAGFSRDKGMSRKVTAKQTAKAILALTEIYREYSELHKSQDSLIKDNYDKIRDALPKLSKLLAGLAVFANSRLMNRDGGYHYAFDLDKMSVTDEPRKLEDQLLMQEAILKSGELLGSDVIRFKALDNYAFLISKMWNPQLGFYDLAENESQGRTKLALVARAIKNSKYFDNALAALTPSPKIDQLRSQLADLKSLWINRFFSEKIFALEPFYQVMEFSL